MKQNIHTHQTAFIKNVCKIFFTFLMLALCINVNAQMIYTYAGSGTPTNNFGYSGNGGQAAQAKLNVPSDVVTDASGNFYIADHQNHAIRKIDANGIITTIAGNGTQGYSGDGGLATAALINSPNGVALDTAGNLYFSQGYEASVRKIDINGIITTVAGNGTSGYSGDGGLATLAQLDYPSMVKVDRHGTIFIADYNNNAIRKVDTNGIITTVAGTGTYGYNGDTIQATSAELKNPFGIELDAAGNLYIADSWNNRIRKVDTNGIITTIAGTGNMSYNGDGIQATSANLNMPLYLILDAAGNLYISEYYGHRIRKMLGSNGIISTIAGNGFVGYSGDGGQATAAKLNKPCGLAFDNAGKLYFADEQNHRIRALCTSTLLSINASTTTLCSGETVTLTASGATTYTWSTLPLQTEASITVTPVVSVIYAVFTTDNYGCQNEAQIMLSVSPCTDIDELKDESLELSVYPNPANGMLNVSPLSPKGGTIKIFNMLGGIVLEQTITPPVEEKGEAAIDASELEKGIYFIKVGNKTQKFLKE
ncbi:MAG: T9SS type A sorting domain-containing protein [Bacteroidetes bacterium]|nr:T9SS type A sorting domain-containing protein [Bacteroidota bacterium]